MTMLSRISRILRPGNTIYSDRPSVNVLLEDPEPLDPKYLYRLRERYYANNQLYDAVRQYLADQNVAAEAIKPLRNPVNRAVEFHVAKLWPGQLGVDGGFEVHVDRGFEPIVEAIYDVWTWSNWGAKKQVAARWFAKYGDLFLKVVEHPSRERIYYQVIHPEHMVDFDTDERGFITYCRIDVPYTKRNYDTGRPERWIDIEVWEKDFQPGIDDGVVIVDEPQSGKTPSGRFRRWDIKYEPATALDTMSLPDPIETKYITDFGGGIDFIPIVHAKFKDDGDDRGVTCFDAVLDKIDEANRIVTRLHQMQFRHNQPKWALAANSVDPISNRPIPAPQIEGDRTNRFIPGRQPAGGPTTVTIAGETYVRLPGTTSLTPLVPALDYGALLETLNAHLEEVQKDLPELAYYELRSAGGELSGRAILLLLQDAIDRVIEARANAYEALKRANMMALTIGKQTGLFTDIPADWTFDGGQFEHSFSNVSIIATSKFEDAETELQEANAKLAKRELGVDTKTLRTEMGYTEQDVQDQDEAAEGDAEDLGQDAIDQFIRGEL